MDRILLGRQFHRRWSLIFKKGPRARCANVAKAGCFLRRRSFASLLPLRQLGQGVVMVCLLTKGGRMVLSSLL